MLAVAFHPDGMYLLGGGEDGIRRWQLADGQEVGKQMGMQLQAIAVSRDCKWIVCGMFEGGASVWDAEMHEKLIEVGGRTTVRAVDVSPDSTRFATGTGLEDNKASVWSITNGKRLIGPLEHDKDVAGIKFSPNGEQVATCCEGGSAVRIFDSRNGDKLIDIKTTTPRKWPFTPLAWSSDSQQIFSVSDDNRIKSFAVSTGSQVAESPILDGARSISLAGNRKFIAAVADHHDAISFLDTLTLAKIGTAFKNSKGMQSIDLSLDTSQIATGRRGGKIDIYNLANFLPDSYGPFHVSICPFIMLAYWINNIPCRHTTLGIYSRRTTIRRPFDLR